MNIKQQIGQQIQNARKLKGWSQEKLAEELKIGQPDICNLEKGRRTASNTLLQRISDKLGVEIVVSIRKVL